MFMNNEALKSENCPLMDTLMILIRIIMTRQYTKPVTYPYRYKEHIVCFLLQEEDSRS
jgi:hypothetical protein